MARRRLNQKVLIYMAAGVGVPAVAIGAVVAWKATHKDPTKYVNAGDLYLQHNDLPDALAAYSFASGLRPTDPQLHLKIGKIHDRMRDQDFWTHIGAATDEYTKAEELAPTLKEAWQGLLDTNMAAALATSQGVKQLQQEALYRLPERFGIARDAAQHLLALDPGDSKARAAIPILTINLWLQNLSIPLTKEDKDKPVEKQPTETALIDRAVAELTAVMRDHPENADLPFWIAQAKIEQGVRLARQANVDVLPGTDVAAAAAPTPDAVGGDPTAAIRTLFGEAAVVFDDPIARLPKNATLPYRKAEVLGRLTQVDRDPSAVLQYQEKMRAALDAAQSLVTPADGAMYVTYKSRWADFLSVSDVGAAEAVYKQLLARPTTAPAAGQAGSEVQRLAEDTQVRLQYAQLLAHDPARRTDALAVLDAVPTSAPTGLLPGAQQAIAALLAKVRLARAQVLIDQYEASGNPTTRLAKAKAAQAEIDAVKANPRFAGEYEVLKSQGRLQLVTGSYRDAIQTLSAAADRQAGVMTGTDFELLYWLAQAYANGQQSGQAIKLLEQSVQTPPGANLMPPHLMLADLYLKQADYINGRKQVGWLSERYPDDVRTIHLQIDLASHDGDAKAVTDLYNRLPERTAAEQAEKARWAVHTNNLTDAERLEELVYAARPGDPATAYRLSQLYHATGNQGRANEVIQQAMDAHPESRASLQLIKDQVNNAPEPALQKEARDQILAFKDPMLREMGLAHLAGSEHRPDEQIDHLERAHALQPDDRKALNELFVCYLQARAYDKAEALLPKLTELDADQAHGLLFKYKLAMARHDTPTALKVGQQLTRDLPQLASSWASLGEAMQVAGQLEGASQQYRAALDRQGNDPAVVERLVDCLIGLGRLDDARRALADVRNRYPDAAVYRKQLVQTEVAYGDPEAVLSVVDEGIKAQPEEQDNWQSAVQAYAAAAQRRTAKADGDGANALLDHARQLLADALKRWPDNAGFASELADLQVYDGTAAGVAAAKATYDALAATPKWQGQPLPFIMMGRTYVRAKQPELAEPALRHALALDAGSTEARSVLSDALVAQHRPDEALAALAPAKDRPAVRAKYIDLLLSLGRAPQAEAELGANPDDPGTANLLAHVYTAEGKFDAAQDLATRSLKAHPDNAGALFVRGDAESRRTPPDLDGAIQDLTGFRQAFPNDVPGRLALAKALLAKPDVEGAIRELEPAVELAPDSKETRLLLARVYLSVTPARTLDAERVVAQALTLPSLAHDPDVERVAALVYLKAGDTDRAVNCIRDAMAHVGDQRAVIDDYLGVLLAAKRYDVLLDESAKFAADNKAGWSVYDFRGRARAGSGDAAGAVTEFSTALDRAGTSADLGPALTVAAHAFGAIGMDRTIELVRPRAENGSNWKVVLASVYDRAGDRARALTAVEPALASVDSFPVADRIYVNRLAAQLCMTAVPPQTDRAVELFGQVLKQSPDDLDALNDMACLLAEQVQPPRPAEALAYAQRAVDGLKRTGQVNPLVTDTDGWVLILNGKLDEGIDVLHQVVGTADFPDVHYHLAEGYLKKGSLDDARRELALADQMYQSADANHRPVDTALLGKIEAAQKQAGPGRAEKVPGKSNS